eukprot:PLAT15499.4.p2 GENE.PLAT15499.4~~PLAT15499.4.p2  ORF type:complete len:515 (+),score=217.09 PLAT15499.4:25-1569(+)
MLSLVVIALLILYLVSRKRAYLDGVAAARHCGATASTDVRLLLLTLPRPASAEDISERLKALQHAFCRARVVGRKWGWSFWAAAPSTADGGAGDGAAGGAPPAAAARAALPRLHRHSEPYNRSELMLFASAASAQPLAYGGPLWEPHLFTRVDLEEEGEDAADSADDSSSLAVRLPASLRMLDGSDSKEEEEAEKPRYASVLLVRFHATLGDGWQIAAELLGEASALQLPMRMSHVDDGRLPRARRLAGALRRLTLGFPSALRAELAPPAPLPGVIVEHRARPCAWTKLPVGLGTMAKGKACSAARTLPLRCDGRDRAFLPLLAALGGALRQLRRSRGLDVGAAASAVACSISQPLLPGISMKQLGCASVSSCTLQLPVEGSMADRLRQLPIALADSVGSPEAQLRYKLTRLASFLMAPRVLRAFVPGLQQSCGLHVNWLDLGPGAASLLSSSAVGDVQLLQAPAGAQGLIASFVALDDSIYLALSAHPACLSQQEVHALASQYMPEELTAVVG